MSRRLVSSNFRIGRKQRLELLYRGTDRQLLDLFRRKFGRIAWLYVSIDLDCQPSEFECCVELHSVIDELYIYFLLHGHGEFFQLLLWR